MRVINKLVLLMVLLYFASCTNEITEPEEHTSVDSISSPYIFASDSGGQFNVWKYEDNALFQLTNSSGESSWWPKYNGASNQILYYVSESSNTLNDCSTASLYLMDKEGSDSRAIIDHGANGFEEQGLANWSYDGEKIVFSARDSSGFWQLYLYHLGSTEIQKISLDSTKDYLDPCFNIDDKSVFFISSSNGSSDVQTFEIFELDIETSEETRITFNETRDHHPVLSPDGNEVLFEALVDEDYLGIGMWKIASIDLSTGQESVKVERDEMLLLPQFGNNPNEIYLTHLDIETFSMGMMKYNVDEGTLSPLEGAGSNSMNVSPL